MDIAELVNCSAFDTCSDCVGEITNQSCIFITGTRQCGQFANMSQDFIKDPMSCGCFDPPTLGLYLIVFCSWRDYITVIASFFIALLSAFLALVMANLNRKEKANSTQRLIFNPTPAEPGSIEIWATACCFPLAFWIAYFLSPLLSFFMGMISLFLSLCTFGFLCRRWGFLSILPAMTTSDPVLDNPKDKALDQIRNYWIKHAMDDFLNQNPQEQVIYLEYVHLTEKILGFSFLLGVSAFCFFQVLGPLMPHSWILLLVILGSAIGMLPPILSSSCLMITSNYVVECRCTLLSIPGPRASKCDFNKLHIKKELFLLTRESGFSFAFPVMLGTSEDENELNQHLMVFRYKNFEETMVQYGTPLEIPNKTQRRWVTGGIVLAISILSLVWIILYSSTDSTIGNKMFWIIVSCGFANFLLFNIGAGLQGCL